jgi:hypothetical protein
MVAVKQVVGHNLIVVVGSMRKSAPPVAIAQRPDAGDVGLQLIVNLDVAALAGGNSRAVETQVARVRNASRRE